MHGSGLFRNDIFISWQKFWFDIYMCIYLHGFGNFLFNICGYAELTFGMFWYLGSGRYLFLGGSFYNLWGMFWYGSMESQDF